jgi:hypothetical protein
VGYNQLLLLTTCLILVCYLTYSLTIKMETKYSSETSIEFHGTTRRCVPESRKINNIRSENVKFNIGTSLSLYADSL